MEHVSGFWIYVLAMLPDIKNALDMKAGIATIIIASLFYVFVCLMWRIDKRGQELENFDKTAKKNFPKKTLIFALVVMFLSTFLSNFIPNYKQAAVIIGGTWAVNNENVRQLPDEIAGAVNRLVQSMGEEEK